MYLPSNHTYLINPVTAGKYHRLSLITPLLMSMLDTRNKFTPAIMQSSTNVSWRYPHIKNYFEQAKHGHIVSYGAIDTPCHCGP